MYGPSPECLIDFQTVGSSGFFRILDLRVGRSLEQDSDFLSDKVREVRAVAVGRQPGAGVVRETRPTSPVTRCPPRKLVRPRLMATGVAHSAISGCLLQDAV